MSSLRIAVFVVLVMRAMTVPGLAQNTAADKEEPPPAPAPAPFTAGWQDGFVVQSADGDYRLVFGLVSQADGRFSLDDPKPIINTFVLRKLRPTLSGRLGRFFDFKVMPDFGNGTAVVQDAYLDIRFSQALRVRTGKDKTPVGYELLQGDAFLWFPERSLASSLVPNRDVGAQVQGDIVRARLAYAAGVFNGIPDASSSTTELDTNNAKDFAGRIVVQPFRTQTSSTRPLAGLGFHVGGSRGSQAGPLPSFRTSVGQTYFSYATGATAHGTRTRVSPAVFYYYKSLGAFAEYMRSAQTVGNARVEADVENHGWEVSGSFMLTGEAASYGAIRPKSNFDPPKGRWGALQVLARYAALTVDADAFATGLAATAASRGARSFTIAANWYPNGVIKYYATFERTTFLRGPSGEGRGPEDVILFRAQVGF
jgi:phosphate-selective porin OprO/OprP